MFIVGICKLLEINDPKKKLNIGSVPLKQAKIVNLPMTLKLQGIVDHYSDHFKEASKNFRLTNGEHHKGHCLVPEQQER